MDGEVVETGRALVSAMEPIYLGIFEGDKGVRRGRRQGRGEAERLLLAAAR
jgi:hypothetical protein